MKIESPGFRSTMKVAESPRELISAVLILVG